MNSDPIKPATKLAQALGWTDASTGALSPPVHCSSTFLRSTGSNEQVFTYARDQNPGYLQAEQLLAELEGGSQALLFGSGMAAATAVFLALPVGAHVVAPESMYWGLRHWLVDAHESGRLQVEFIANGDMDALQGTIKDQLTRLVWIETPANPGWEITDIRAAAVISHAAGAQVCVDSTVATPLLTQPLAYGADLVMHSATKYLNGHSDIIAGALVTAGDTPLWQKIRTVRHGNGAILGSFEAWLLLRGMRTLALRVAAACRTAQFLALQLQQDRHVHTVLYPGLTNHPGHAIAQKQMTGGFGGMLSIRLTGGASEAARVAADTRLWKQATSLGGVESLIEHRLAVEGSGSPVPGDLLRLSVGIEAAEDLLADLQRALAELKL